MSDTYVLGDWGTTNLRLLRFADGRVLDRFDGPGIGALETSASRILGDQLAIWKADAPISSVTLCGMAGARGGLVEAMHVDCPLGVSNWRGQATRLMVEDIRVAVMPGLRYWDDSGVPDVIRGEETQIFGALLLDPALAQGSHAFLLPGTHSKWVRVEDGIVRGFRTCPTGELYALLISRSTLVANGTGGKGNFDQGFDRGLVRSDESPLAALFEARSAQLLDARSQDWARGYLSGLLIGNEVASQVKSVSQVTLVGDPKLSALYMKALEAQDCAARCIQGEAAVLAGLQLAKGDAA